ncbi:UNVERIFIED_CONTAM: hypothetical protein Scaly_2978600 [Sesamum calycinum]|uniref:DUF4218 domain-containing protein n=1 Tax=Sesamum calycinum TaxID=2727403 RepID=A0AAW2KKT1_9LAMI
MLYSKDDIDMEYCKFCGDPRYKPTRDRNPRRKKSPYAILRWICSPRAVWSNLLMLASYNYTIQSSTRNVYEVRIHVPDDGVRTHDHATNQAFMMRAALIWTVNDLPGYGMTSGWSTTGIMGYPIYHPYRRKKKAFIKNRQERNIARPRLTGEEIRVRVEEYSSAIKQPLIHPPGYGTNHKWTKKSIFWDLPYWTTHLIRHNLDVMHIEKNVFENIFNTVMDIKGKSKDNLNARKDLAIICNRPELQVDERRLNVMPKAVCVDMTELRLHGMKSHDCHIFMQKLILVVFREMVPEHVWSALTEVSLMFQVLCSTTLDIRKVQELEDSVAVIMCNLEKVFPPAFFDSMEHLILHLPYEARVGGPVQYRFLRELKKKVKNKAHFEASIVEAYIVEEIGWFTSHYFEPHVTCKRRRPNRNDDLTCEHERISRDIFNHPGRPSGALKKRYATEQERHMMETYVLCNSEVAAPYYESFLNELYKTYSADDPLIDRLVTIDFIGWFKSRVESELQNIEDDLLRSLYWGPKQFVKTWPCYFVNGFNFHTEDHNVGKSTMNCGVCVKISSYRDTENDFYGMLEEIIELDYPLNDDLHVVLFKCRWVDPTRGMKIDEEVPVPKVNTNNHTYDLHDPDGLQLIVDLTSAMQHGVGTSRLDEDDEDEDDEDSFDDYETNEEREEQDNNSD